MGHVGIQFEATCQRRHLHLRRRRQLVFDAYNTAGLSYPAVSSSVTPVARPSMPAATSGHFSQRNQNVLAAPAKKS